MIIMNQRYKISTADVLANCSVAAKLKLEQHIEGLREGSKGTHQVTIIVIRK